MAKVAFILVGFLGLNFLQDVVDGRCSGFLGKCSSRTSCCHSIPCTGGICKQCTLPGGRCNSDDECCSKTCFGYDVCGICKKVGEACNSDCCSGNCKRISYKGHDRRICQCSVRGQPCYQDSDCCKGKCKILYQEGSSIYRGCDG